MLRIIRYYSSITILYILTIGTIGIMLQASHLFGGDVRAEPRQPTVRKPVRHSELAIAGSPVRITIPTSGIDLVVDEGDYDQATKTWTLSPTHAQFAVMTTRPNNYAGTTFIYGHGTDAVFGKIGTNHPPIGTHAQLHTDNHRVFVYELQEVRDLKPSDTSILHNTSVGPPQLIVQTCTGALSEWRTMFIFAFRKVT